ncbi:hypothetical protein llap_8386 [Limosa lapponica baueri]|uniref:Uncharacterized protein n=1 Tax=Limosa lapponica baueri TaxID=1758121 RepID=A0A2I0U5I2_LIMLA|nr:hypothetical protein llap_8386 [Limosa lapponica baueri]
MDFLCVLAAYFGHKSICFLCRDCYLDLLDAELEEVQDPCRVEMEIGPALLKGFYRVQGYYENCGIPMMGLDGH